MLASERIHEIENLVIKNGRVTVLALAEHFHVSPDLIRKDLRKFENHTLVQRVHGGAVLKRNTPIPSSIDARIGMGISEKKEIAAKAVALIGDKKSIFLDISSVSYYIAEALQYIDRKITVITNMFSVSQLLIKNENIQLVSVGGEYDHYLGGFIDPLAQHQVKQFITDIAFVGTGGLDTLKGTLSIHNIVDGQMKHTIISMSKEPYIIATQEHFSIDSRYIFEQISNVAGIITDSSVSKEIIERFNTAEIRLIY